MFDGIFEAIEEWMRGLLTGMVESNLTTMFTDVNEKTGEIAAQVGQTPQGWNGSIFSLIQNLSDSVIVPIAGMIITFVLCYELISMFTEKNNMHEVDTWMFFKYFFKMWVAVYLVSHTFDITMAVFDVGQHIVNAAGGVIESDTAINVDTMLEQMKTAMESMEIGELVILAFGNHASQFMHENHVCTNYGNSIWKNDRNLSLYLGCTNPVFHDVKSGIGDRLETIISVGCLPLDFRDFL